MSRSAWRLGVGMAMIAAGCGRFPRGDAPLTIATTWPAVERSRLTEAFTGWAASRLPPGGDPIRIAWVAVEPGTDLARLADRLDMVLGVPGAAIADLERLGRLAPFGASGQPAWRVARRLPIGWASDPQRTDDGVTPLAIDDPRRAPVSLAWARGVLAQRDWANGYASLVETAAHADYAFCLPRAALAAVARGEAAAAPTCIADSATGTGDPLLPSLLVADRPTLSAPRAAQPRSSSPLPVRGERSDAQRPGEGSSGRQRGARMAPHPNPLPADGERGPEPAARPVENVSGGQHKGGGRLFRPGSEDARWVEAVAILRGGDSPTLADLFLQFLSTQHMAAVPQPADHPTRVNDDLLADLLGATLVDAQNELTSAWRAWERAGRPAEEGHWLTEAPPWPPASVDKLLKTDGAGPLLATLTEQITPDADTRAWLRRSWLLPARHVDGALLGEIAGAVEGRLAREPRFRAWLRAEWTAWVRQRYRRVERQLGKARASTAAVEPQ